MSTKKNKYYCVWQGKQPGVYDSWEDCERQVKGVEGARYKAFATRQEALTALEGSYKDYYASGEKNAAAKANWRNLPPAEQPLMPAIAVDGACSGNPGQMEYQGVDASSGRVLFHFGPQAGGTNNIAEFLAIVHALALMKKKAAEDPAHAEFYLTVRLYSDSRTAQAWVRERHCKTKLEETPENAALFPMIARAEQWLQTNTYRNPIIKWDTERWGEIPADFGRK